MRILGQKLSRYLGETQCEWQNCPCIHNVLMTPKHIQTQVLVDVLGINVRNPFWGDDSESFDPTRFKTIKQSDVCVRFPNISSIIAKLFGALVLTYYHGISPVLQLRYNLHVFGFGSRKCMGQYVAGHIAKALVVHLFQQYEVLVSGGGGGNNKYNTDKSSWTPKADASLQLTKR